MVRAQAASAHISRLALFVQGINSSYGFGPDVNEAFATDLVEIWD